MDSPTLVLAGITGDLVRRKLIPALYELYEAASLPENVQIIGTTRQEKTVSDIIQTLDTSFHSGPKCDWLQRTLKVVTVDIGDGTTYGPLHDALNERPVDSLRLYYLAVPPSVFTHVIDNLASNGLNGERDRLLVEKPFGYDLTSAQDLIQTISQTFDESAVYRIDHYLAKDTIQNILTFRFRNPLFARQWNRQSITSIRIIASENIGIEGRSDFYEQTGALRDFVQNHLLQMLTAVTMEKPRTMDSASIHDARLALLASIATTPANDVQANGIRGQYQGYTDEVNNAHSGTETFAALRLRINTDTWQDVPIVLVSGKALADKKSIIEVAFASPDQSSDEAENILTFTISSNEGVSLKVFVKQPGLDYAIKPTTMSYTYDQFSQKMPDAYAKVIYDAISGKRELFPTSDEVVESWRIVQPFLDAWARNNDGMTTYPIGTDAHKLLSELI